LNNGYHHVHWNPSPLNILLEKCIDNEQSLTVCSNRSNIISIFGNVLEKVYLMKEAGGYLSWYERYGCKLEDFEESIDSVQQIIADYYELYSSR